MLSGSGAEPLGKLALRDRQVYFEYDVDFIKRNLNVSPFQLPLKFGVQTFDNRLFEGLPGLFDDSLPDGWGRLLFDRALRSQGLLPEYNGVIYCPASRMQPDYIREITHLEHLCKLIKTMQCVICTCFTGQCLWWGQWRFGSLKQPERAYPW